MRTASQPQQSCKSAPSEPTLTPLTRIIRIHSHVQATSHPCGLHHNPGKHTSPPSPTLHSYIHIHIHTHTYTYRAKRVLNHNSGSHTSPAPSVLHSHTHTHTHTYTHNPTYRPPHTQNPTRPASQPQQPRKSAPSTPVSRPLPRSKRPLSREAVLDAADTARWVEVWSQDMR
jgi:hypothetical protein